MTKLVPLNPDADICLTNRDFGLDGSDKLRDISRVCLHDPHLSMTETWINGYCLFRICEKGLTRYMRVGCSDSKFLEEVNNNVNDKGQLVIVGIDVV